MSDHIEEECGRLWYLRRPEPFNLTFPPLAWFIRSREKEVFYTKEPHRDTYEQISLIFQGKVCVIRTGYRKGPPKTRGFTRIKGAWMLTFDRREEQRSNAQSRTFKNLTCLTHPSTFISDFKSAFLCNTFTYSCPVWFIKRHLLRHGGTGGGGGMSCKIPSQIKLSIN